MRGGVGSILALCALVFGPPSLARAADIADKAPAASASQRVNDQWEAVLDKDVRFFSWSGTRGHSNVVVFPPGPVAEPGRGMQVYVPVSLELTRRAHDDWKVEILVRSGAVWSHQESLSKSGEIATTTDTSVSTKVTYYGIDGVQPYVSLAVNVPTGTTVLKGNTAFARMDSDIVDIATFGEGWNIAPTIGANIPIMAGLIAGVGVGYTNRGAFDREGAIDPITLVQGTTRLDPGDTVTATTTLAYKTKDKSFSARVAASHTWESTTTLNSSPFYKSGNRYQVSAGAAYWWNDRVKSTVSAQYQSYARNKVAIFGLPDLVWENFNSNSAVVTVNVGTAFKHGALSIGPVGGYMNRNNNAWSPTAFQFLPAKTKWSAGVAGDYAVNKQVNIAGRIEHYWIRENENPEKTAFIAPDLFPLPGTAVPIISAQAWLISLAATIEF